MSLQQQYRHWRAGKHLVDQSIQRTEQRVIDLYHGRVLCSPYASWAVAEQVERVVLAKLKELR